MALPAVGGLLAHGDGVVIVCDPKYSQAINPIQAGIAWAHDAGRPAITPNFKGCHRADAWLRHFEVRPERVALECYGKPMAESLMPGLTHAWAGATDLRWVVLSPWADHPDKRWPIPQWTSVAQRAHRMGLAVAVIGPPAAEEMAHRIANDSISVNLVGKCTPQTWPSLLERAKVVISPDTGCVHMADALGIPTIGLYGATKLNHVGPYWDRTRCIEADSMDAITADRVGAMLETIA